MPSKLRTLLYFFLAVLLASVMGTVLQTQFNLANLQALGAPMPLGVRVQTTCLDLLGFSPTFAVLVILGFTFALPAASLLARVWPMGRWLLFILAGAIAVLAAMALANALLPMPTLIGANRSLAGTLGLMACGSLGALLFAVLVRRSSPAQS
ncbi:conserved membrane hypothetical protein [Pseudomonas sp. 8BK]|uniref:Uncharacterized protein n=1 Tax=Pseudomonas anguilliseptica TaxID=53406 RepID=A0A1H4Z0Y0_PSEAG|nr:MULTISPECIES: hypothetical protein [Pseudomonas]SED23545.1 hypothetical protein SAMN05421553_2287 [Pseudomonas anguilliseptica]VXA93513.1 conserved membrane hypothetical protein [Pseudomonas sp. 8BK]